MHAHSASQASHGRRGSSATADISPYLSRPHDIPKEMKYISMLESVAKESDRMASRMEHRPGMPQVAPMGDRASFYPAPPASVPPFSAMHGNRVHSPVIYSSGPVAPLSSVPPQQFSSIPPPIDDPFVVRPRTSHQFHPVPYPLPGSKANLTEEQLQSLSQRNASWGPFPPSAQVAYPPFTPQVGGPHPSLRIVPPGVPTHHLPIPGYGIAPSLSSPAISPISPTFNLQARNNAMRAANNAHLLSILNSGLRTGIDVTHSGYTGIGPR
ncbi:hypothetical protein A0H81_01108 [Grifola frondosa]|uniref:Uncharacterized protein n=1 Tax=Grifola frondosa TaxID=5627 RepID=A0A1C7MT92_GRIFR|nr:hypothetical protein A0H81_01108 [Grifola frondosa]